MRNDFNDGVLDALVIGAGFGGLYQLYSLRERLGLSVRVLEAGAGVGGTWYWNRYPGARCDSESHAYCYSFSEELTKDWQWSERYPGSEEIMRYLNHVADRFELRRDITFNCKVVAAHYNETDHLWSVHTDTGHIWSARFLITAVGCLSTANIPAIEGLDSFAGHWYHTGQWPPDGVDFRGKRVGQIGTGSTGIQAAPVIAATADHLTVFQRTANYSVPARNRALSESDQQNHRQRAAEIRQVMRSNTNGHPWTIDERLAVETPAAEREKLYQHAWQVGGLKFRSAFADLLVSTEANNTAAEFIRNKICEIVKDPITAKALANIDHPYGAKRPPIDTGYFETFNLDHVDLVDIKAAPIKCITHTGICTTRSEYDLDIIVFATGFDAMTGALLKMDIRGRDGITLADAWSGGPRNYLGLQTSGFPNMFSITGPGSPSVLTNMPVAIEQHVEWITDCIGHLQEQGYSQIECTEASVTEWVDHANQAANATLLPTVKHSWYLGANMPGKPRVFMPYAGGMAHYKKICDEVAENGYRGFVLSN